MSWEEAGKRINKGPGSTLRMFTIWAIVIGFALIAIAVVFKPFDVISTVTKTDKLLYNYEYFYNQSEAYKAINRKITAANKSVAQFKEDAGPRVNWTFEDKTEMSRLRSIADGLGYQCNDIVADYNANSQKLTRNIFKTNSTPYKLQECN